MVKNGGSGFKREMCINDTWVKWDVKVDKTKNVMSFSYEYADGEYADAPSIYSPPA